MDAKLRFLLAFSSRHSCFLVKSRENARARPPSGAQRTRPIASNRSPGTKQSLTHTRRGPSGTYRETPLPVRTTRRTSRYVCKSPENAPNGTYRLGNIYSNNSKKQSSADMADCNRERDLHLHVQLARATTYPNTPLTVRTMRRPSRYVPKHAPHGTYHETTLPVRTVGSPSRYVP
jgi:hypothetical protein